jgi:hypothetical protein
MDKITLQKKYVEEDYCSNLYFNGSITLFNGEDDSKMLRLSSGKIDLNEEDFNKWVQEIKSLLYNKQKAELSMNYSEGGEQSWN